jgi:hypothetical protein
MPLTEVRIQNVYHFTGNCDGNKNNELLDPVTKKPRDWEVFDDSGLTKV